MDDDQADGGVGPPRWASFPFSDDHDLVCLGIAKACGEPMVNELEIGRTWMQNGI